MAMEQNLENYDFGLKGANVKILKKNSDNVNKSKKCNQCDYVFPLADNLRRQKVTKHLLKLNCESIFNAKIYIFKTMSFQPVCHHVHPQF